jgi:hypothetical protein
MPRKMRNPHVSKATAVEPQMRAQTPQMQAHEDTPQEAEGPDEGGCQRRRKESAWGGGLENSGHANTPP